jgi:MFS family permease
LVRWVNRQLYVLGAAIFVMALSISLIAAVEPELNRRLSQTALGFGFAFSMSTLARVVFQIPVGTLSDRIGRKPLIFLGLVVLAPSSVIQGLAPTTFWLSVDRFVLGAATAMIVAPAYAMVADRGLPGLRVRQMGIMTMSFGLGVAAGPLLSGTLAGVVSFETPFLMSGALCTMAAFMVHVFVNDSRGDGASAST